MDTINDGVQGVNNKLDGREKRRKNTVTITYNRSLLIQCTSEAYIILCINRNTSICNGSMLVQLISSRNNRKGTCSLVFNFLKRRVDCFRPPQHEQGP